MEGRTENFTPRGQNSPLGNNFAPGCGSLLPRGEVKNGPQAISSNKTRLFYPALDGHTVERMRVVWKKGFDQSKVTENNYISLTQFEYAVFFEENYEEEIASGNHRYPRNRWTAIRLKSQRPLICARRCQSYRLTMWWTRKE
jgi:hypothetical protein